MNTIVGTTASSQSKFIIVPKTYSTWFNGTNTDYVFGFTDKLNQSGWLTNYGIDSIKLRFSSITINNVVYDGGNVELFSATDSDSYGYRNDGYGIGMVSYIDLLNNILASYKLRTRFFPAAGNQIVGKINTAENFEVHIPEFCEGPDITSEYKIKCVYGIVTDTCVGNYNGDGYQWN